MAWIDLNMRFGPWMLTDEPALEPGPQEVNVGQQIPMHRRIGDLITEAKQKTSLDNRWKPIVEQLTRAGAGAWEVEGD